MKSLLKMTKTLAHLSRRWVVSRFEDYRQTEVPWKRSEARADLIILALASVVILIALLMIVANA